MIKHIVTIILMMSLSGCTATDWIDAAGGIMQGKDKYEKDARSKRIKAANKASGH